MEHSFARIKTFPLREFVMLEAAKSIAPSKMVQLMKLTTSKYPHI